MKRFSDLLGIELNVVSAKEKIVATMGGTLAILLLFLIIDGCIGVGHAPALVASMGASAVLLFAVPHGQLSQPWPVLGGHVLSAAVGVASARWIDHPALAAAAAVGMSIGVMHQLKCIHPPGGATALTAVLGGTAVRGLGFGYVLCPVLVNAMVMVGVAIVFNAGFRWRRYPAAWSRRVQDNDARGPGHEDVVAALRSIDLFVDLDEGDLLRLSEAIRTRVKEPDGDGTATASVGKFRFRKQADSAA